MHFKAEPTLSFSESEIRRIARERLSGMSLPGIVLRQAFSEHALKYLRGVNFRKSENSEAAIAYRAMSMGEFEGINARQRWANWRTLPRNLSGRVPNRSLNVLDLCCGVGHSTEVLACYLPIGSRILGLEFNPDFVMMARGREARYVHRTGQHVHAEFVAQSVLETFRDAKGVEVPAASVDLVNCCGALGVHFKPEATRVVAREIARVLKVGGLATLDSGEGGTNAKELTEIFEALGFQRVHAARSCFVDRSLQVCLKKVR
jgi:SAM-dependent methyltransferase